VFKEALLTSSIEGIHTTLLDVFTQPIAETAPSKETQLVLNYTKALGEAISLMQQGLPISSRLLLAAHQKLFEGQGNKADPGHYRKQGVRVGAHVPPSAQEVPRLMSELENFIHHDTTIPSLIKIGLVHVQFETIHPFLDGNGRIGRLLIVLMLIDTKLLNLPVLYPSYYFKKERMEYYARLDAVRLSGDFEGWIHYYLKAIKVSAENAYKKAKSIEAFEVRMGKHIEENISSVHAVAQLKQAVVILFRFPVITIPVLAKEADKSYNTANSMIDQFVALGMLKEHTQQKRNKAYVFTEYLELLDQD
jgi:Fic family protein